ncbi:MAG: helix-turn-helix transcriptional regulator [Bacillota bacterium]
MTQRSFIGSALIRAMFERAAVLGLNKYDLSREAGITYQYLAALSNGSRPVTGISHDKLRRIAGFLNMTFVQVLMLAEIVIPGDFARDQGIDLERTLDRAIENMRSDADWGRVAPTPEEWEGLSLNSRIGIAMMWEQVSQQDLIAKAEMVIVEHPNGGVSS